MTGPERRPVREDFLVFGAPAIGEDEIAEVVASCAAGGSAPARRSRASRATSRRYNGRAHAVAVSSCTAALHLAHAGRGCRARATR